MEQDTEIKEYTVTKGIAFGLFAIASTIAAVVIWVEFFR